MYFFSFVFKNVPNCPAMKAVQDIQASLGRITANCSPSTKLGWGSFCNLEMFSHFFALFFHIFLSFVQKHQETAIKTILQLQGNTISIILNVCLNLQSICGLPMTNFWLGLEGTAQDGNFSLVIYLDVPFFPPNMPLRKFCSSFWDVSL